MLGLHSPFINMKRTSKNSGKVAHYRHLTQSIDADDTGYHFKKIVKCCFKFYILYLESLAYFFGFTFMFIMEISNSLSFSSPSSL